MPGYVRKVLNRFDNNMRKWRQDQLHPHNKPNYGDSVQYATSTDESLKLNAKKKKFIQQVLGTFLYYARAVYWKMLVGLSEIAEYQADPSETKMAKSRQLLDYSASQEDAVVTYKASNTVLAVYSNALYLSKPKARSRAGGYFFMSNNNTFPENNGAVLSLAHVSRNWDDVYQRPWGGPKAKNDDRYGTPATMYDNAKR